MTAVSKEIYVCTLCRVIFQGGRFTCDKKAMEIQTESIRNIYHKVHSLDVAQIGSKLSCFYDVSFVVVVNQS